jgi:hypothetical protein
MVVSVPGKRDYGTTRPQDDHKTATKEGHKGGPQRRTTGEYQHNARHNDSNMKDEDLHPNRDVCP